MRSLFLCLNILAGMTCLALAQDYVFKSPERQITLIELYSSEGCSSCPPAENWFNQWKSRPELWQQVVPVVFHVDYWDQLGWPDRFARPQYTQRQRAEAARLHQDSVYTPEFIVNGHEWRGWFKKQELPTVDLPLTGVLRLNVKEKGQTVEAQFTPISSSPSSTMQLQMAWLGSRLVSDVKRGENGGHTLQHEFVVLALLSVPLEIGKEGAFQTGPLTLPTPLVDPPSAVAAWVTSKDGSLIQATGGWIGSDSKNP